MPKAGAPDVSQLVVGGLSILPEINELTGPYIEHLQEDDTPFGVRWPTSEFVGVNKASLNFGGFYNDRLGGLVDAMMTELNDTFVVSMLVISSRFTGFAGIGSGKFDRVPILNGLSKAKGSLTVRGEVDDGRVVQASATKTADWNTEASAIDFGLPASAVNIASSSVASPTVVTTATPHGLSTGDQVSISGHDADPTINGIQTVTVTGLTTFTVPVNVTTGGSAVGTVTRITRRLGAAYLEVTGLALGGHSGLSVKVRHSHDNLSFADLGTFTTVTASNNGQRLALTGPIRRYIAISGDFTGAGSPTAVVLAGVAATNA